MDTIKNFIPSLLTLINLCCGFTAIIYGELELGAVLIICGAIADLFDGAVARMLNATSDIGLQLDSLADMVSFGLAPAYLYYLCADYEYRIIPALFYVSCAAYRLAKFNTLPSSKYFLGVASPSAGLFLTGLVYAFSQKSIIGQYLISSPILYFIIPIIMGIMMNISLKMFSFKSLKDDLKVSKLPLLVPILAIGIALFDWKFMISGALLSYMIVALIYRPKS